MYFPLVSVDKGEAFERIKFIIQFSFHSYCLGCEGLFQNHPVYILSF